MNRFPSIVLICLSLFLGLNGCGSEDVDLTVPDIALDAVTKGLLSKPVNAGSIAFSGTMDAGAQVTATVNTTATLTSIVTAVDPVTGNGTWSGTISNLTEGINVVTVTANDRRGNLSNLSFVINYDSIKPTVSFDQFFTPTPLDVQTFGGLVEAGAEVSVVSKTTLQSCAPVFNNGIWSCSFSGLVNGDNIEVKATDSAGNTNTATQNISWTTNAPLLTIDAPPPINVNSIKLSGDLASGYSVQVTPPAGVTAEAVDTTTTPGKWSCKLNNLQLGNNVVKVTFQGNVATSGGTIVQYDAVAPLVTSVTPAASATVSATPVTSISAVFSEQLDAPHQDGTSLTLKDSDGNPVTGTLEYALTTRTLTLKLTNSLTQPGTYTATLAMTIKDLAQNSFAGSSWTFTVQ